MKLAFYTSITNSYFAKARILAQSVKFHYPESYFIIALLDRTEFDLTSVEPAIDEVWKIEESGFPNFTQWIYTHDVVEACTAQKGFALQTFLRRGDFDAVIYLDPDTRVFAQMIELEDLLAQGKTVVTPHLTAPSQSKPGIEDNEFAALQHGSFNLGFVAVPNNRDGLEVADWWDRRLRKYCYDEKDRGIFTDQKWFDLVPGMFDAVEILRHPGYNLATWNIENRRVDRVNDQLVANGEPLRFIHFSGYDSGAHHSMIDAYAGDQHVFKELSREYEDLLVELSVTGVDDQEWCFRRNHIREIIPRNWRRRYRDHLELRAQFPNPFEMSTAQLTHRDPLDGLSLAIEEKLLSKDNLNAQLDAYRATRFSLMKHSPSMKTEFKKADVGRLNRLLNNGRPTIAIIEHGLGGGLEVHAQQLGDLVVRNANVLRLSVHRLESASWELRIGMLNSIGVFDPDSAIGTSDFLRTVLDSINITRLHLHSAYRTEDFWLDYLRSAIVPLDITIHDFTLLTSNWSMEDGAGRTFPIDMQKQIIEQSFKAFPWRTEVAELFASAQRTIFPSLATKQFFERCVEISSPVVAYHPEFPHPERIPVELHKTRRPNSHSIRVGILGDLASHKGLHLIHELASKFSRGPNQIEVFHFGERHPTLGNLVRSVGRYDRSDIASILRRHGIQVALLPSQVHETYGYALTDAMLGQLPIVASNVGAFPERLAGRPYSHLVDANSDIENWAEAIRLVLESSEGPTPSVRLTDSLVESRNFYLSEYL